MRLFITYETRGGDKVRREWKEMESEGERHERRLSDLDDSYTDLGKSAEASGKRQQGALAKTARAIGSVQKKAEDLGDTDSTVRVGERGARETTEAMRVVSDERNDLDGSEATVSLFARGVNAVLRAFDKAKEGRDDLDSTTAEVGLTTDGAVKTEGVIKLVQRAANKLDGKKINVLIGGAATIASAVATRQAIISVGERLDLLSNTARQLAAQAMPLLFGAAAAGTGTITALGTSTLALVQALGSGALGFGLIGGAAAAAAGGGLLAYRGAATAAVTGAINVRDNLLGLQQAALGSDQAVASARQTLQDSVPGTAAYAQAQSALSLAVEESAKAHEDLRRVQILNTPAARAFNSELGKSQTALTRVQAELGRRVLPSLTRMMQVGRQAAPQLTKPLYALSEGVSRIGEEFVTTALKGQRLRQVQNVLNFVSEAGVKGAFVLRNLGFAGLSAVQAVIGPAGRLLNVMLRLSADAFDWTRSAEGAITMENVVNRLERRMYGLLRVAGNLGSGFAGIFSAFNEAGITDRVFGSLIRVSGGFARVGAEGTKSRQVIIDFSRQSEPVMRALMGVVGAIGAEFGRLAMATVSFRAEGQKNTVLVNIFNAIRDSIRPVGDMMLQMFQEIGPLVPDLIRNLGGLLNTFGGYTPVLATYLDTMSGLLDMFNGLPQPIKNNVANIVALSTIMKTSSGISIPGMIGALVAMYGQMNIVSAVTTKATLRQRLFGRASTVAATQTTAAGAASAASATKLGFFSRAGALASTAARGLGAALRWAFVSTPWGFVLTAIALAAVAIVANWSKIRPALQPAIDLFNRARAAVANLARVFTGVLTGNLDSARAAFMRLPAGLRPLAIQLAQLAMRIRLFVAQGLTFLRTQGMRFLAWWRASWPVIQRVGGQVLTRLGQIIRSVAGPVFAFLLRGAKQIVGWFRTNWPLIQRTALTVFRAVSSVVRTYINMVRTLIMTGVRAILAFWRANHNQLRSIVQSVWRIIQTIISAAVRILGNVIRAGLQIITGDWSGAWRSIQNIGRIAAQAIQTIVRELLNIVVQVVKMGVNTAKSVWDAAWSWIGDKTQGARDRIGRIVGDLKSGLSNSWDAIKSAASSAWDAISGAIWRPVETAYNKVTDFLDKILGAVNKVLGWVGIDPIGEGSNAQAAGSRAVRRRTPNRSKPIHAFARGGVVDGEETFLVGDKGQREYVFNPSRPDNVPLIGQAAREIGMGLHPLSGGRRERGHRTGRGRSQRNPYVPVAQRRSLAPPWWVRGGEGLGPTTYTWIPQMQDFVDAGEREFPATTQNTYTNHPMGFEQPYYRERSADLWGSGGRGDPIGTATGDQVASWAIDYLGNNLNWLIWNGRMLSASGWGPDTSGFDHSGHDHITAFADGPSASGSGSGGGLKAALFERGWNRLVQPIIDRLLDPLTGSENVMAQFAGAAAKKVPEGIKEWAMSKLGGLGGGSGLSGTPAQNRALGEKMFPDSGLPGQFSDVDAIWTQESGWDHTAQNPSSSAFGIPQFMDTTWEQYGGVSRDAEGQIRKGYMYIGDRYGDTGSALAFKQANGWYGRGGMAIGPQIMGVAEAGANELVLPLGDRRVYSQVQGMFQIEQMRNEIAGLRNAIEDGITIRDYGQSAREVIVEGTLSSMRGYARSTENREIVHGHMGSLRDLSRIGGN